MLHSPLGQHKQKNNEDLPAQLALLSQQFSLIKDNPNILKQHCLNFVKKFEKYMNTTTTPSQIQLQQILHAMQMEYSQIHKQFQLYSTLVCQTLAKYPSIALLSSLFSSLTSSSTSLLSLFTRSTFSSLSIQQQYNKKIASLTQRLYTRCQACQKSQERMHIQTIREEIGFRQLNIGRALGMFGRELQDLEKMGLQAQNIYRRKMLQMDGICEEQLMKKIQKIEDNLSNTIQYVSGSIQDILCFQQKFGQIQQYHTSISKNEKEKLSSPSSLMNPYPNSQNSSPLSTSPQFTMPSANPSLFTSKKYSLNLVQHFYPKLSKLESKLASIRKYFIPISSTSCQTTPQPVIPPEKFQQIQQKYQKSQIEKKQIQIYNNSLQMQVNELKVKLKLSGQNNGSLKQEKAKLLEKVKGLQIQNQMIKEKEKQRQIRDIRQKQREKQAIQKGQAYNDAHQKMKTTFPLSQAQSKNQSSISYTKNGQKAKSTKKMIPSSKFIQQNNKEEGGLTFDNTHVIQKTQGQVSKKQGKEQYKRPKVVNQYEQVSYGYNPGMNKRQSRNIFQQKQANIKITSNVNGNGNGNANRLKNIGKMVSNVSAVSNLANNISKQSVASGGNSLNSSMVDNISSKVSQINNQVQQPVVQQQNEQEQQQQQLEDYIHQYTQIQQQLQQHKQQQDQSMQHPQLETEQQLSSKQSQLYAIEDVKNKQFNYYKYLQFHVIPMEIRHKQQPASKSQNQLKKQVNFNCQVKIKIGELDHKCTDNQGTKIPQLNANKRAADKLSSHYEHYAVISKHYHSIEDIFNYVRNHKNPIISNLQHFLQQFDYFITASIVNPQSAGHDVQSKRQQRDNRYKSGYNVKSLSKIQTSHSKIKKMNKIAGENQQKFMGTINGNKIYKESFDKGKLSTIKKLRRQSLRYQQICSQQNVKQPQYQSMHIQKISNGNLQNYKKILSQSSSNILKRSKINTQNNPYQQNEKASGKILPANLAINLQRVKDKKYEFPQSIGSYHNNNSNSVTRQMISPKLFNQPKQKNMHYNSFGLLSNLQSSSSAFANTSMSMNRNFLENLPIILKKNKQRQAEGSIEKGLMNKTSTKKRFNSSGSINNTKVDDIKQLDDIKMQYDDLVASNSKNNQIQNCQNVAEGKHEQLQFTQYDIKIVYYSLKNALQQNNTSIKSHCNNIHNQMHRKTQSSFFVHDHISSTIGTHECQTALTSNFSPFSSLQNHEITYIKYFFTKMAILHANNKQAYQKVKMFLLCPYDTAYSQINQLRVGGIGTGGKGRKGNQGPNSDSTETEGNSMIREALKKIIIMHRPCNRQRQRQKEIDKCKQKLKICGHLKYLLIRISKFESKQKN